MWRPTGATRRRFFEVMRPFKGRLLVADEAPRVLEGTWQQDKVVLIWFPDEAAFREWESSEAYQRIAVDRMAGAETVSLLLQGFADSLELEKRETKKG